MKISEVKIKNFRCIENLELKLSHTHALIGENGSGKTAVLEAINYATSGSQPYLNEQDFNNKDLGDLSVEVIFTEPFLMRIPDGYTTQDIPCQSIILQAHRREKAAPGKALSEPFVIEKYAIPLEYTSGNTPIIRNAQGVLSLNIPVLVIKTASGYEATRKGGNIFKFTTNRLTLQNDTVDFPNIFYFDRDREEQARTGFNSLFQKIAKDLNWRFRKSWNQAEVNAKWEDFYNAVISTVENPKTGRIIQPIREKMNRIAGADFTDLELGLIDIEQPFLKSFFSKRDGTNQIDHGRFGSGISVLLAYFLLETISHLSKGDIIFLIDEPELHLHPQLQYSLFKEFQLSPSQTIYTTQSDCLISIAEWGSISRFKYTYDVTPKRADLDQILEGKKLSEHLDEIKKWHQHRSIFFREDNQIFFARKCLLVEGPAEKYGLPILAQKLGKNIDGITIISCNGKGKIPYYQLLCKSFGIPFYTLFDLDSLEPDHSDNIRPHDYADPVALSTFSTNFESILGSTGSHKTSNVFIKIDNIRPADIPKEIIDVIESVSAFGI